MKKSLNKFAGELESAIGLPVAYRQWEENNVPDLPYLIYYETGKNPFYADNRTHYFSYVISVELYTENKDPKIEALLEAFFYAQNITVSNVEEMFWDDEHLHEVLYEFEIGGE